MLGCYCHHLFKLQEQNNIDWWLQTTRWFSHISEAGKSKIKVPCLFSWSQTGDYSCKHHITWCDKDRVCPHSAVSGYNSMRKVPLHPTNSCNTSYFSNVILFKPLFVDFVETQIDNGCWINFYYVITSQIYLCH